MRNTFSVWGEICYVVREGISKWTWKAISGILSRTVFNAINSRLGSSFSMNRLMEISKCDCSRQKPVDGSLFKTPQVCSLLSATDVHHSLLFSATLQKGIKSADATGRLFIESFSRLKLCKCWALLTRQVW